MKKIKLITCILILLAILFYFPPLFYLHFVIKPTETYPEDSFLKTAQNKHALVIVAHNDDSYGSVATVKLLTNMNWYVRAFYFSSTLNQIEDNEREEEGIRNANSVADLLQLQEFSKLNQTLRFDSIKNHKINYPYDEFKNIYLTDSVERTILSLIDRYQPSSKICTCGCIKDDLKLSDRTWTCSKCNLTHDRDIVASKNIKKFALQA